MTDLVTLVVAGDSQAIRDHRWGGWRYTGWDGSSASPDDTPGPWHRMPEEVRPPGAPLVSPCGEHADLSQVLQVGTGDTIAPEAGRCDKGCWP